MKQKSTLSTAEVLRFLNRIEVFATRRSGKDYSAIQPSESISVGGEKMTLEDISGEYAPILYVEGRLGAMRPKKVIYDALYSSSGTLFINFYVFWPDEIHPNPLWHAIYREFRKVFYGSEKDIEYIQIGVDTASGEVVRVAFERDPSGRHDHPSPMHQRIVATRNVGAGSEFAVEVEGEAGAPVEINLEARRAPVFVATWNHTHDFHTGGGVRMADPPLEYMDEAAFNRWCMPRRSRPPV